MGMLSYGAMAGVGGEWLKQSEEQRENDFTLLRDKRMSELKKGETTHASDLIAGREEAARKHGDENYTFGYGENVVRGGEVVQTGGDRPTAGSTLKGDEHTIYRANGQPTTYGQLYNEWWKMAHRKNQYGEEIRDESIPAWEDWLNAGQVQDQYRINPKNGVTPGEGSAKIPSTADWEAARKDYNEKASIFRSDQSQLGMSEDEWVEKRAHEKMQARLSGKKERGGMLTEEAKPKPQQTGELVKLKKPLSIAAKTDPVQMYDELQQQGFDEIDIVDTIRWYHNDPTWEIPPNALQ